MADVAGYFVPFDLDTGGGTQYVVGMTPRGEASGGSLPIYSAPAALVDNTTNPTTGGVSVFPMYFDGATWDRVLGDATDGLLVNIGTNNAVTITGAVDTELPAAVLLSDALTNPTAPAVGAYIVGYDRVNDDWTRIAGVVDGEVVGAANAGFLQLGTDGSNYQVVLTDSSGALQVDVLSGGGSPPAPTNPVSDSFTSVDVAAQSAAVDIDSTDDDNRKLAWIDIFSSVNWKGEVFTIDNAIESSRKGVTGGPAMTGIQYIPVHEDFIQVGSTAGVDAFRLKVTNLDDNLPADFHVVFHYND